FFQTAAEGIGLVDYEPTFTEDTTNNAGKQLYALAYFAVNSLGNTTSFSNFANPTETEINDFADYVHVTS
ncbi:hypothetical protein, partial [Pseudomonas juntendi]|uniref:hypothetical protein n=1 Tax=Pseudomonas juntendi TaxID=2666183 RepID=UPI003F76561D